MSTKATKKKAAKIKTSVRILNQPALKEKFQSHLFGESFSSCARERERMHWLPLKLSLLSTIQPETTQNRRKICDSWNSTTFLRRLLCFSKKNSISIMGDERWNIWIKSFRVGWQICIQAGPLSNHNCAFQLHHVTKLLNVALPKKKSLSRRNCLRHKKKLKEISSLKLFKMMTVLSWSCFSLKKRVDKMKTFLCKFAFAGEWDEKSF